MNPKSLKKIGKFNPVRTKTGLGAPSQKTQKAREVSNSPRNLDANSGGSARDDDGEMRRQVQRQSLGQMGTAS